ncbi:MAG: hypothetical protein GMKNLPBB_00588 [Myxococcota bacterium]|nr:hypothetical protein [Myxococcota bacterium]
MDYLVELGQNKQVRDLMKTLGLQVNLPAALKRHPGPVQKRELAGKVIAFGPAGEYTPELAAMAARCGADLTLASTDMEASIRAAAEPYGAKVSVVLDPKDPLWPADALVYDASGARTPEDLHGMFAFFQPRLRSLKPRGRCLVAAIAVEDASAAGQTTISAIEGFTRSLAKEAGRKGSTANALFVAPRARQNAVETARFFLSDRSSFLTSVILRASGEASP